MLTPKATVGDVELLFMLFGGTDLDDPAPIPLSDEVAPGVPYPLVALAAADMVVEAGSALLLCA